MCQLVANNQHAEFMYVFRDIVMALSNECSRKIEIYEP